MLEPHYQIFKDKLKEVKIGEWIDNKLNENIENIERLDEKDQELLKLDNNVFIPTTDDNGNVSWGEISAVTRHNPGYGMFKIITQSGKEVKVVESKSLIVWNELDNKFNEINTSNLKIENNLKYKIDFPTKIWDLFNLKKYIKVYKQINILVKKNPRAIFYLHTPVASHLFRFFNFFYKIKIKELSI